MSSQSTPMNHPGPSIVHHPDPSGLYSRIRPGKNLEVTQPPPEIVEKANREAVAREQEARRRQEARTQPRALPRGLGEKSFPEDMWQDLVRGVIPNSIEKALPLCRVLQSHEVGFEDFTAWVRSHTNIDYAAEYFLEAWWLLRFLSNPASEILANCPPGIRNALPQLARAVKCLRNLQALSEGCGKPISTVEGLIGSDKKGSQGLLEVILRCNLTTAASAIRWVKALATVYCPEVGESIDAAALELLNDLQKRVDAKNQVLLCPHIQCARLAERASNVVTTADQRTLIDGILRRSDVASLVGPPKSGKSSLACQLALCVATGQPFLGYQTVAARVLYCFTEKSGQHYSERLREGERVLGVSHALDHVMLAKYRKIGEPTDSLHMVAKMTVGDFGSLGLIVIDSLRGLLAYSEDDENNNLMLQGLYCKLRELAEGFQCAVLVVHHTSKGAQANKLTTDLGAGGGAIAGASDGHLGFIPSADRRLATLRGEMGNFPPLGPLRLRQREFPIWELESRDGRNQDETSDCDVAIDRLLREGFTNDTEAKGVLIDRMLQLKIAKSERHSNRIIRSASARKVIVRETVGKTVQYRRVVATVGKGTE